jgi:hypothetical protein
MPRDGRVYKWAPGSTFKTEAQVAGEFIEELRQQNDGAVTPEMVWRAAEDPDSPIHDDFEWNERKAAENHWKERARNLVNHIVVVRTYQEPADEGLKAFVSIVVSEKKRAYVDIGTVKSDEEMRQCLIDDILSKLEVFKKRYAQITELDDIWAAIERAEKRRARSRTKKAA